MDPIHVLLVEDEQTLAMIIKDTLEGQGFRIRLAKDGEEGLQCFFHEKPDVLVADVMMPRMDGFEMVRRIRAAGTSHPHRGLPHPARGIRSGRLSLHAPHPTPPP